MDERIAAGEYSCNVSAGPRAVGHTVWRNGPHPSPGRAGLLEGVSRAGA